MSEVIATKGAIPRGIRQREMSSDTETESTTSGDESLHGSGDTGGGAERRRWSPSLGFWSRYNFEMVREDGRDVCLIYVATHSCTHVEVSAVLEFIEETLMSETELDESLLVDGQGRDLPVVQFFGRKDERGVVRVPNTTILAYVSGDWRPSQDDEGRILFDRKRVNKSCECDQYLEVDVVACVEDLDNLLRNSCLIAPNIGSLSFEGEARQRLGPYRKSRRHRVRGQSMPPMYGL